MEEGGGSHISQLRLNDGFNVHLLKRRLKDKGLIYEFKVTNVQEKAHRYSLMLWTLSEKLTKLCLFSNQCV